MSKYHFFFTLPNTIAPISLITFLFLTMLQIMYESLKVRLENVLKHGKVSEEFITNEQEHKAFHKWTDGFTRQDHSTVIQVYFISNAMDA